MPCFWSLRYPDFTYLGHFPAPLREPMGLKHVRSGDCSPQTSAPGCANLDEGPDMGHLTSPLPMVFSLSSCGILLSELGMRQYFWAASRTSFSAEKGAECSGILGLKDIASFELRWPNETQQSACLVLAICDHNQCSAFGSRGPGHLWVCVIRIRLSW